MKLSRQFQACFLIYLFSFYEKISPAQKHSQAKQATFILLKVCERKKLLLLLFSVCLNLFSWLMFACDCFRAREIFSKKKQTSLKLSWEPSFTILLNFDI